MWSNRANEAYKRLTRTINVPAAAPACPFWDGFNLELVFDYMVVEAHTVGQDDWTTLPDQNGHTSNDCRRPVMHRRLEQSRRRGEVLHPFLNHYQTFGPRDGTCPQPGTGAVR